MLLLHEWIGLAPTSANRGVSYFPTGRQDAISRTSVDPFPRINGFRDHIPSRTRTLLFFREIPPPGKRAQSRVLQAPFYHLFRSPNTQLEQPPKMAPQGAVLLYTGRLHKKPTAVTTWSARIAKFHQPCLGQLASSPTGMHSRGLESVPLCSTMPRSLQIPLSIVNLFFSSRAAPAFRMFACALERRN